MLQIFKTGNHSKDLTPAALAAVAAAYDPKKHEAPIVVGHPKNNAPAHGWIAGLQYDDATQSLMATPTQVDQNFKEAVEAGRYKKISTSFYPPGHPANPTPENFHLRHVGFLGAQVPAVKGLRAIEFADDKDVLSFELDNFNFTETKEDTKMTNDTDDFAEKAAALKAREDAIAAKEAALSAKEQTDDFAEKEAALKAREDAIAAKEEALQKQSALDFAEGLVKAGQILPRDKQPVADLVHINMGATTDTIEFSENEKTVKKPAGEYLRSFLTSLPVQVEYSEVAVADAGKSTKSVDAPDGHTVDGSRSDQDAAIQNYAEQHQLTYIEATDALIAAGKIK